MNLFLRYQSNNLFFYIRFYFIVVFQKSNFCHLYFIIVMLPNGSVPWCSSTWQEVLYFGSIDQHHMPFCYTCIYIFVCYCGADYIRTLPGVCRRGQGSVFSLAGIIYQILTSLVQFSGYLVKIVNAFLIIYNVSMRGVKGLSTNSIHDRNSDILHVKANVVLAKAAC